MRTKWLIPLLSIFLVSCGTYTSFEYTERYYRPLSTVAYAAKSDSEQIPILNPEETRRIYKIIGELEFETGGSKNWLLDVVQYHARRNGADAVILQEWEEDTETYVSWYPFTWSLYNRYHCDYGFSWYYSQPMYTTNTYVTRTVKAQMVVFLDHDSFGHLGFILEDVRNAPFLEVGHVITGSSAEREGLRPGDRVFSIGEYKCEYGLESYLKLGPLTPVGQEFEVIYERDGNRHSVMLLAEKIEVLKNPE